MRERSAEGARAAAERERKRQAATDRRAESATLEQLEFEFGDAVDRLDRHAQRELLAEVGSPALQFVGRLGPKSPVMRPSLLKAFAERYGHN